MLAKQCVEAIENTHRELFAALKKHFDVNCPLSDDLRSSSVAPRHNESNLSFCTRFVVRSVMYQDVDFAHLDGYNIVLVATGGTEGLIVKDYDRLPHPLVLLTDGKANSLAATLELSTWIRNKGDECTIIHGSIEHIVEELQAKTAMFGQRIGVLGAPSDWLVSSGVDYEMVRKAWGVEYVDIPLSKVEDYYAQVTDSDASIIAHEFAHNAKRILEPSDKEITKSVRLYLAIKRIVEEYCLNALTIQCFSLITSLHTTGCVALALLNDDGIVAGCEGDLQTIFTMLYAKMVMGKDSFMANPAFIDTERNEIVFAHCTIGLKQTMGYVVRSHFESQSGVAIQGILPLKKVTIMKFGGRALEKSIILHGTIVENQDDERKCRTQIRIALDSTSNVDYFLTRSIGNHHVIF